MSKTISLSFLIILLTSCNQNKTIYVAPTLIGCEGVTTQQCLQIKENKEDDWTLFYNEIEGLDYKEGYTYKIDVTISKVKNPPADGSSLKYKLVKIHYMEPSEIASKTDQNLSGNWKVQKMIGMEFLNKAPTLKFSNGKISGNAGCNNYSSDYTITDNSISFGLTMATKMYCTDMKIEDTFFDCLKKISSFEIENNSLKLFDKENKLLISCISEN